MVAEPVPDGRLELVPISLREARAFVARHHRHNEPPRGWLCGVGIEVDGVLVGVAILGRPVAPGFDRRTAEVTRVCTVEGTTNAASRAYGAMCRAAAALGYRRVVTYTLADEPGTSLRAAGFRIDAELRERGAWQHTTGPRAVDNGVRLCGGHHRLKTNAGKTWRPVLLDYLERVEDPHAAHVDPCGLDCRARIAPF